MSHPLIFFFFFFIWTVLRLVPKGRQIRQIGSVCLRTHSVCNCVGIGVSDPGHFPLSCAHVWSRDIDARSWWRKRTKWMSTNKTTKHSRALKSDVSTRVWVITLRSQVSCLLVLTETEFSGRSSLIMLHFILSNTKEHSGVNKHNVSHWYHLKNTVHMGCKALWPEGKCFLNFIRLKLFILQIVLLGFY